MRPSLLYRTESYTNGRELEGGGGGARGEISRPTDKQTLTDRHNRNKHSAKVNSGTDDWTRTAAPHVNLRDKPTAQPASHRHS